MEFVIGVIGNLVSELISGASRSWYQGLADNVKWKKWKATHHLSKNDNDFLDRFAEALVELHKAGKSEALISFYGEEVVITLIHHYIYNKIDKSQFEQKFTAYSQWFTLDQQLAEFSTNTEIRSFLQAFDKVVHLNRTVGEIALFNNIIKIKEKLTDGSHSVFRKHLTRIPSFKQKSDFIGRTNELNRLNKLFDSPSNFILLYGLGGIGKTTLATAYINQYEKEFDHIAWIAHEGDLRTSFVFNHYLTMTLDLPKMKEEESIKMSDIIDRFRLIMDKLQYIPGRNLLIIDNAESQLLDQGIHPLLPAAPNWSVLLTSRNKINGFEPIALGKLEPDDAHQLFRSYYSGQCTEQELEALVEEIDYHPLTIELLARLLEKSKKLKDTSVSQLLKFLQQKQLNDPKLQETIWSNHSKKVRGIYLQLIKAFELTDISKNELWLLKLFVVLPTHPYSPDTLAHLTQKNANELNSVLNNLAAKGWLSSTEEDTFTLHRIIKQVIGYQVKISYPDIETLTEQISKKISFEAHSNPYQKNIQWLPHAIAVEKHVGHFQNEKTILLQSKVGDLYKMIGQYENAIDLYKKVISIKEASSNEKDVSLGHSYNDLAAAYSNFGKYEMALTYTQKAIEFSRQSKHPNTKVQLLALLTAGQGHTELGDFQLAIQTIQEAIELNKTSQNDFESEEERLLELAACYNGQGIAFRAIGRHQEARESYEKAIEIEEGINESHPRLAHNYDNLGNVYDDLGDYDKVIELNRKSIELRENNLNPMHPDLAFSYQNRANILNKLKQTKEALKFAKKALHIRENAFSKNNNHYYLASSYNQLNIIYTNLKEYDQAISFQLKAIDIYRQLESELSIAIASCNLSRTYIKTKQFQKALSHQKEAIAILLNLEEYNPQHLATFYYFLGEIHLGLEDALLAYDYHEKCLSIREKGLRADHPKLEESRSRIQEIKRMI